MPDLILRKLRKAGLIFLVSGLAACAHAPESQEQPLSVDLRNPLDAQAFAEQELLSFDVYADGDVLHALFALASAAPKQPYLGYLRSEDGGMHWSKPIDIGRYAAAAIESGAGNEVQIAGHGDSLLAVWQVTGEIPGMGPLQAVYSQDGGQTWLRGDNPTGSETDQSHPDLAADQQGRFHLVWLDDRDENGYQGLRYARSSDAGRHWELAQTIDDSSCSCCWNRLLVGPDGEINALYRDMEPRDMSLAASADAGRDWRRISTVGEFNWIFDGCPHNGGALAGSRIMHSLVWTGEENKAGLYYLNSGDRGKSWSAPQTMGDGALAFHSDIAVWRDKRVLAIWDARGAEGSVVMISESFDAGKHWSAARQLSAPGSSASFPRLAATAAGFVAMWAEQKPGASKQWMSAILK